MRFFEGVGKTFFRLAIDRFMFAVVFFNVHHVFASLNLCVIFAIIA